MRPYDSFLMSRRLDEFEKSDSKVENEVRVLALPARGAIFLIGLYQRYVSPYTPPSCRFYPTCSCYTREAIERFGLLRGGALGAWRIVRCNPMCKGGDDPVPLKFGAPKTPKSETLESETIAASEELAALEMETPPKAKAAPTTEAPPIIAAEMAENIAVPTAAEKAPPRAPR